MDGLVVTVVENYFDESLLRYKTIPGFHYFSPDGNGAGTVCLDREIPPWRSLWHRLRVGMYLIANLEVGGLLELVWERVKGWLSSSSMSGDYVENSPAIADPVRVADSNAPWRSFLDRLPGMAGLPISKILLVVDSRGRSS
ncbi:MAG: hypothetical protein QM771_08495 [Nitrospira sp.]